MKTKLQATITVTLALLIITTAVLAAVPSTISYQGYLQNSDGTPVTIQKGIVFSLYSSSPARNNPVWRETQNVTPQNGVYSVTLGSVTPIAAPFDVPYHLGVKVEDEAEMPLQPLSSVPYALRAVTADTIPAASVGSAALADSSVTTAKIASGAVTDTQISGTISAAKLDLSNVQKKYAKTAVVAQSGGDYTSPVTAMSNVATWCGTPSSSNPCLLKIMPGIYDLGSGTLAMQQYVDIEGAGELATTITSTITGQSNGTVRGASNAELRFLTVKNTAPYSSGTWGIGIKNADASPRLSNLTVAASVASYSVGIYNIGLSAKPVISNVTVTAAGIDSSFGVINTNYSYSTLINVSASALGLGINYGIHNYFGGVRLINVIATGTGGSAGYGMNNAGSQSYTIIIDRSTLEGSTNSIYNSDAGYTLKIGASKLIGPIGTIGTYQYFASYSDSTTLDSATIGTQTIQTGSDSSKGLIVKANNTTQSANLQEWQNSAGSAVASISPAGIISGNGAGLTGVAAATIADGAVTDSKITGPISDSKLTSNIARLSSAQTFTGSQTFANTATFANAVSFSGASSSANFGSTSNVTFSSSPAFNASPGQPFSVSSTTQVANLNAEMVGGKKLSDLDARYAPAASTTPPAQIPRSNTLTTVDATTGGQHTSITIGADGLPVISNFDVANGYLKVAKCGNAACSSGNTITTVDSSGDAGRYSSIAIGADGLPVISYQDAASLNMKVAKCGTINCSNSTITSIDTSIHSGSYSSIAIGTDGFPVISYSDGTNLNLKVAKCGNASCSSDTTISTIDSAGDIGTYTSITIGPDGLPIISYYDFTNLDLKVAKCSNTTCSAATVTTVDSVGSVGQYTSISIGADTLPIISYYDLAGRLKVLKCGVADCSSGNLATTVDNAGTVGMYTSITVGMDGLPVISYYDVNNGNLKVAKCGNLACSGGNVITTVDNSTEVVGQYSGITIGADGLPVISYYDNNNTDLKVVKCANNFCLNNWSRR